MQAQNNIVEYFSGHDGYRCGYCKSTNTNYSHGMWAHCLTPKDYENLLNRGWRRSGKYLYKPTNHRTCCPCYTISCHVLGFRISKSQKKVLKKFNEYLLTGVKSSSSSHVVRKTNVDSVQDLINYQSGTATTTDLNIKPNDSKEDQNQIENSSTYRYTGSQKRRKSEPSSASPLSVAPTPPSQILHDRPKGQKAKFLRLQRKMAKWAAQGINPDEELAKRKKARAPQIKSIEEFLNINVPNAKNRLEIRIVKVGSPEFDSTFTLEHSLYEKYQMTIHNDEPSECTKKQFRRFLVDNPLNEVSEDETGSYHQQYYINGQLIAVGVIDILPSCLSSVYFFYDPAFMFLTLGTFGALREVAFVRNRFKTHPNFQFYNMGFYIHSCSKMRYKANFFPSYLLCPETYNWKALDSQLRKELDKTKYIPFCTTESRPPPHEDINQVSILYRRSLMPYGIYKLQRSKDDTNQIQEYVDLVGGDIAQYLSLYRSLG